MKSLNMKLMLAFFQKQNDKDRASKSNSFSRWVFKPRGYYRHISKGLRRFHRLSTGVVKIQRGKEYPVYSCNYHATQKLRNK